jgi:hypothetical protein
MGSKPKSVQAPKADYSKDISSLLSAFQSAMPRILSFEQQYRPEFQRQNLADVSQFGLGMLGLSPQFTQGVAQQLGAAREDELGQMTGQTGMTRGLMAALSPEQASVVQASAQEAERARASAQGVTPEEQRMYQQTAREAAQASGRLGGNSAIAAEIMGREDMMARKRAEAAQAGTLAFDMASQFYTQPGLQLLGSQPLSYQVGNQMMGLGLDAIGAGKPQLFDVGSALNLGAANRQNQLAAAQANAQAKAMQRAAMFNAIGEIGGSVTKAVGQGMG